MVNFIMKNDILAMNRQGKSNREIAKRLGISRNTVNKYVNEAKTIMENIDIETDQRKVFTGDLEKRFYELIKLDEQRDLDLGVNKQKLSAARLHRVLIDEGFKVGQTTIRNEFRIYKEKDYSNYDLATDISNTAVVIAPMIPWNIAVLIPATTFEVDSIGIIPYAFYLSTTVILNYLTLRVKEKNY